MQHENGEARKFYEQLAGPVRVGIEATGYTLWFEKMLAELGQELWAGDAAKIRASVVRKQKTDKRDAAHILDLLVQDRFPRIWMPTPAERDLRQLVLHRVKLVQMRTKVMNQLHAMAMGQGLCRKKKLWSKAGRAGTGSVAFGTVGGAAAARSCWPCSISGRSRLRSWIGRSSNKRRLSGQAVRLMTHPGVGPVTSLAFVLTVGTVDRFRGAGR